MRKLSIYTRKVGHETGVLVSIRHLINTLGNHNIFADFYEYVDDQNLLELVKNDSNKVINIHVPSFTDETLEELTQFNKRIIISIHSTILNLQAEGGLINRILDLMVDEKFREIKFTCPSFAETEGFNLMAQDKFLYLPNTFSYGIDQNFLKEAARSKSKNRDVVNISLFCAYRPLKNIFTQLEAVKEFAKTYNVRLHILDGGDNPIYRAVLKILNTCNINYKVYSQMSNKSLFLASGKMHIGLQVSLSETLSYVALEHMACGVPVVGSNSVPYANVIADYTDYKEISKAMHKIMSNYMKEVKTSLKTAEKLINMNNLDAVNTIREVVDHESQYRSD